MAPVRQNAPLTTDEQTWIRSFGRAVHRAERKLGRAEQLATNHEALRLMVRAISEGLEVLRANDIPITPSNHREFQLLAQEFRALNAATRLPTPAMDRLFEHLASAT